MVGCSKTFNLNILKAYRVKLMCGEKTETFNLIVSKTMQVNNNVKRHLQFLRRRLPSASTSMSLVVRFFDSRRCKTFNWLYIPYAID